MAKPRSVSVLTTGSVLLWQASTGLTGEPTPNATNGIFYPGTSNDPLPILVENNGTNTVYLGTSAVTTSTGEPLAKGASVGFSSVGGDSLYAIAATGTTNVRVLVGRRP